jgi:protein-S-isoprenylcysteine O-methyltransferase Ste14
MARARDNAGVIAPPPLLALAAILIGLALDWLLPAYVLRVLLTWPQRLVIGGILFVGCCGLGFPALLAFRAAGTHVEPWKPASVLVTGGLYRYLRNPMYVGLMLFLTGLAIALASDWMLVMTVVFALVLHFGVVKREERYLAAKFGEPYLNYSAAVPRYGLPF